MGERGVPGRGPNNFNRPTDIAWLPDGTFFVADGYGSQFVLRYDKAGKFLSKFGGRSTQPVNPGKFMQAHGIALDTRGPEPLLVCTERIRNEFNWFTLDGVHVRGVYLPGAYVSRPVIAGRHLYSGVCFGAKPDDYRMWQQRGFVTILDDKDQVVSNPGGQAPVYNEGRLRVSFHHNLYQAVKERTPRVRFGRVHVYNNLFVGRADGPYAFGYSIGVGLQSRVISQHNVWQLDGDLKPTRLVRVLRGQRFADHGSLLNGEPLDLAAALGPTIDPDPGWQPMLVHDLDPARSVAERVRAGAGSRGASAAMNR